MKALLDGAVYDTHTATLIGSTRQRYESGRWATRWTDLYRTPAGKFFRVDLFPYRGHQWGSIEPLTERDAQELFPRLRIVCVDYNATFGEGEGRS